MGRISATLEKLSETGRKAVIPYIIAGDPAPSVTVDVMHALVAGGADIVELGVPFSDPMAEGPVIQLGHERALAHQVSLLDVLDIVSTFRRDDNSTPVVLMGYANPIVAMGFDAFAAKASEAGVDGVLTVDLPPEESATLSAELKPHDIDSIFLIAPTTSASRVAKIVEKASGYIYYVSLKGVTGAGHLNTDEVAEKLSEIKAKTKLPVCVGFGIKDRSSAAAVAAVADGVVVGSMLVDGMAKAANGVDAERLSAEMIATARKLLEPIVDGARNA